MLDHWQYFLAIEDDLYKTSRYVDFMPENFHTYSNEFLKILMLSASEIDCVAQLICKALEPERYKKNKNIKGYEKIITNKYPNFHTMEIHIPMFSSLSPIRPWKSWSNGWSERSENSPDWWRSYNHTKHHRDIYYDEATFKNALHSVAGLLCINLYYYLKILSKTPGFTRLLVPKNYSDSSWEPASILPGHSLPD